jgi:hypothetical protein
MVVVEAVTVPATRTLFTTMVSESCAVDGNPPVSVPETETENDPVAVGVQIKEFAVLAHPVGMLNHV